MGRPLAMLLVLATGLAAAGCEAEGFRFSDTELPVDPPECLGDADCYDGVGCTNDECLGFACYHSRPPGLCPGSACVPDLGGCASEVPCAADEDCADDDPCTEDEACSLGRCTHVYLGDRDGDADLQPECGGGDCDDGDPSISVYARESCNTLDDDCDGDVDESSCGLGRCVDGACRCEPGQLVCEGRCVEPSSDVEHCGTCGATCPAAGVCESGVCRCPAGLELCERSFRCNTPGRSARRCGPCAEVCAPGSECVEGECVCPDDRVTCGGECADLRTDARHCGACGRQCQSCEECVDGACVLRAGATRCDGACADLSRDREHCGGCGIACAGLERCVEGSCTCLYTECGGECVDVGWSSAHCGGCGLACLRGATCWGGVCGCSYCDDGTCSDTSFDARHCGGCGLACPPGQGCEDGACVTTGACVDRRGTCSSGGAAEPGGDFCSEVSYAWCRRSGEIVGVIRLRTLAGDDDAPRAVLAMAADSRSICASGVELAPALVRGITSCFDLQGRGTGGTVLSDGAHDEIVGDTVIGDGRAWAVATRCDPLGREPCTLAAWTPWQSTMVRGGRLRAEALDVASVLGTPALAGSFEGAVSVPCPPFEICAQTTPSHGGRDGFLADWAPTGPRAIAIGGAGDDAARDLVVLGAERIVGGHFAARWEGLTALGARDGFVARLRGDGGFAWRTVIRGSGADDVLRVVAARAVSAAGDIFAAGTFEGVLEIGGVTRSVPSGRGVFVVRLDADSGAPLWSQVVDARAWENPLATIGARGAEPAPRLGLAARDDGGVVVAATFSGTLDVGGGALTSAGGSDVLVVELSSEGAIERARRFGSAADDHAAALAIDGEGTAWVAALIGGPMEIAGTTLAVDGPSDAVLVGLAR